MKFRIAFITLAAAVLLSACTLASDITPPPDYIPPTPMPTLGALFPASAPNLQNGAVIFATECVPCHGDQGLGDGPQSQQLPVPVPAIGMAEKGQLASPAGWFTVVTRGQMDRYMPPFANKLSDQQRWDVVSYAMTLHTTPDQLAQGKSLFDANCPNCAYKFTNQEKMSVLSEADLIGIIRKGNQDVPAFGSNFSDADASAVAAYVRTLTFASPAASTPTTAPVSTETPTTLSETPATASTPGTPATPAASVTGTVQSSATEAGAPATIGTLGTPAAVVGNISGTVQMAGGTSLPASLVVTLRGFDHAQDPATQTTSPQEVLTKTGTVAADGTFVFENVELPVNRIYVAEVSYSGIQFQSDFTAVKAGDTKLSLPPVKLYEASTDANLLTVDQVHFYSDFATHGTAQFIEIFSFSNNSDKAVIISTDGSSIPFIKLPDGAQGSGYQAGQNSAPFVSADKGVAVVPSDTPYSIIGYFNLPYDKQVVVNQPFAINSASVLLLIPEGMTVDSKQLTSAGVQTIQNNNYQEFSAKNFKAGDTLSFTVNGSPKAGSAAATTPNTPNTQQGLLIGAGALGLALIVAGVWLYLRDRKRGKEDDEEDEFESADEVMDAMLALDDLHRAGKISDEAYQKRRDELKEILKEMA